MQYKISNLSTEKGYALFKMMKRFASKHCLCADLSVFGLTSWSFIVQLGYMHVSFSLIGMEG